MDRSHFTLTEAADLAGTTSNALRQLVFRGIVVFDHPDDIEPIARGGVRLISRVSVFEVLIMSRLIGVGMKAEQAWEAASSFGEASDVQVSWPGHRVPAPEREPGDFYATGATWIVVGNDGKAGLVNVQCDTVATALFAGAAPMIVLDLNALWAELRSKIEALRLPPV